MWAARAVGVGVMGVMGIVSPNKNDVKRRLLCWRRRVVSLLDEARRAGRLGVLAHDALELREADFFGRQVASGGGLVFRLAQPCRVYALALFSPPLGGGEENLDGGVRHDYRRGIVAWPPISVPRAGFPVAIGALGQRCVVEALAFASGEGEERGPSAFAGEVDRSTSPIVGDIPTIRRYPLTDEYCHLPFSSPAGAGSPPGGC